MSRLKTFEPKDRTRREHIGQLDRVVWSDADRPAAILKLTDGGSVIVGAAGEQFARGVQYRFFGRWAEGKFGPEFKADTFTTHAPLSRDAVVKYLTETCRNVGQVTADRLYSKFGTDAIRTLREEPAAAADAGFLSPDQAAQASSDLARYAAVETTKAELFGLFKGRGFPGTTIDRAIGIWGVDAPARITRDPFTLLVRKLPGCGFKRCDKLFLELGHAADDSKRQAVCAWHCMREDRTGSTWLDAQSVIDELLKLIPTADAVRAVRTVIRAGWARLRRDGAARYVALADRADAERRIATAVRRLNRSPSPWPAEIPVSAADGDGLPIAHQAEQWRAAARQPVGCLIGGPGTGKTHTLGYGLKAVVEEHGPGAVVVCAPTGKAAVRASESLRARGLAVPARTIHQTLEIGRNGHDGGGWGFLRNADNPLDCRFLVVDESSMIDTNLMADLLDALPDGAGVLLIGDPHQLPPVGHGAPLRDLLAGGAAAGELTEVRRNAGAIVRGCVAIKAGSAVEAPEKIDLAAADPANLRILDCEPGEAPDLVEDVLDQLAARGFDPRWETQIITPLNEKSDLSRTAINERLAKKLNPDGRSARGNRFRVGDKIICTRNTRLKPCVATGKFGRPEMAEEAGNYSQLKDAPEVYCANGEIGRVVAVSERHTVARFGGGLTAPLVQIPVGKPKAKDDGDDDGGGTAATFDLAWAITVHRSQGSEWPAVVCLIDDAGSQIADRNFWYTAISRARTVCVCIGPRAVFDRQCKRQAIARRRTFLAELLSAAPETEGVTE